MFSNSVPDNPLLATAAMLFYLAQDAPTVKEVK
jgi:hypothetical protein